MPAQEAKFQVGQIVHHRLFDYDGVIFDVDPIFQGTDEWYQQVASSEPPKHEPWYHVLVHGAAHTTYVAEQNLESVETPRQIVYPLIEQLFSGFDGTSYRPHRRTN